MRKRVKIHAILAFLIIVFALGYCVHARLNREPPGATAPSEEAVQDSSQQVPVILTPLSIRDFEDRRVIQGNLEARNVAMVHARVDATIESIFVDEGDDVVVGKTKLFQIDSLKLEKEVEVRRQASAVAECALSEKRANLERVEADLYKADIDYRRSKQLLEDGTVSSDEFERVESYHKQAVALRKHAQTLIDLAMEQKRQAEAALEIAEKDLRDALVYAPISGKISQRFQEPGEMGDKRKPVLKIVDPSVIEVSAFLPAEYYPLVLPDETRMRVRVYGIKLDELVISYKSPTIDQKLRTFEIKSVVKDPPAGVVPGAMAEIEVLFSQRRGLGVPKDAIQQRGGRTVVFLVENHTARMVPVDTGLESDGWVELKGKSIPEKTAVVTMGQFLLEEGTRVTVQKDNL